MLEGQNFLTLVLLRIFASGVRARSRAPPSTASLGDAKPARAKINTSVVSQQFGKEAPATEFRTVMVEVRLKVKAVSRRIVAGPDSLYITSAQPPKPEIRHRRAAARVVRLTNHHRTWPLETRRHRTLHPNWRRSKIAARFTQTIGRGLISAI